MSEPQLQRRSEKEIFFEMIEKATPQERADYLDMACGKDLLLRRRATAELVFERRKLGESFLDAA